MAIRSPVRANLPKLATATSSPRTRITLLTKSPLFRSWRGCSIGYRPESNCLGNLLFIYSNRETRILIVDQLDALDYEELFILKGWLYQREIRTIFGNTPTAPI